MFLYQFDDVVDSLLIKLVTLIFAVNKFFECAEINSNKPWSCQDLSTFFLQILPPFFSLFWVCNFSVLTRSFSFTTYFIIYWDVKWEVVQYNSYIILCWLIFYYAPIMTYHICNNLILFYEHYHHCHYYYRVEVLMYYTCMHSKMGVDNFVVLKNMWKN